MDNDVSFSGTRNSDHSSNSEVVQLTKTQIDSTGQKILQVDLEAVNEVFGNPSYKEYHVAVYTIAGPSRTGKSFLLSLLFHYLKHPNEQITYEQWSQNKQTVERIFQWKGGPRPHTERIHVLRKPILICCEERKIALFLIDTQGMFDFKTSKENQTFLGTFSFLLSSFIIFNVQNKIETNHLEAIYNYEKNLRGKDGCLIMQKESLMFVVRDWFFDANNDDADSDDDQCFPYGLNGGAKYFETLVEDFQKTANEHIKLLEYLKYAFGKNIPCCLLPSPSEAVRAKKTCRAFDLNNNYRSEIFKLFQKIEGNPCNYKIKKIQKQLCKCRELSEFIKDFVSQLTSNLDVTDRLSFLEKDIKIKLSRYFKNCVNEFLESAQKEIECWEEEDTGAKNKLKSLKLKSKSKFRKNAGNYFPPSFIEEWEKDLDHVLDQIIEISDACAFVEMKYKRAILNYNDWQKNNTSSSLRAEFSKFTKQACERRDSEWQTIKKAISKKIQERDDMEDILSQCEKYFFKHINKLTANIDKDINNFLEKMKVVRFVLKPFSVVLGLGSYLAGKLTGADLTESPLQFGRNAIDGIFSESIKRIVKRQVLNSWQHGDKSSIKLQLYEKGEITMELSFGVLVFKLNVQDPKLL